MRLRWEGPLLPGNLEMIAKLFFAILPHAYAQRGKVIGSVVVVVVLVSTKIAGSRNLGVFASANCC